jgi:hypothetical protein
MKIYIPTRDRIYAQGTWDNLTPELRAVTTLVVPEEELPSHSVLGRNVIARPKVPLSGVRQWLCEICPERTVIMLDDDLAFFVRKRPEAFNLKPAEGEELNALFNRLYDYVHNCHYAHAGVSPRQMNNQHFPATEKYVTRMNAVHCIDRDVLAAHGLRYDRVQMMEDYDITLSLFKRGYKNVQITDAAWDQTRGSGATGGFSHYRNPETQKSAAETLAALHPDCVKVVLKEPKGAWGGGMATRYDVRVQWKKAYDGASIQRAECQ